MTFPPAWVNRLPSVVTEVCLSAPAALALGMVATWSLSPFWVGLFATAFSLVYETAIDANGFSWKDVAQRQLGILAGVALLGWLA